MSTSGSINEMMQAATSSEKFAAAVSVGTTATGVITAYSGIQSVLSLLATGIGVILALVLVIKHGIETFKAWEELKKLKRDDDANRSQTPKV